MVANGIVSKIKGRIIFHLKSIRKSYRNRGYEPRIHSIIISKVIRIRIENNIFIFSKNKTIVIMDRRIILVYSAKKIKAKNPPMYSMLNPDTNSDSPSAKSKGLRFTSARHLISHKYNSSIFPTANHIRF